MSTKKISFGATPRAMQPAPPTPSTEALDRWVENGSAGEPLKRLSIDIPSDLHMRIKIYCARHKVKMGAEIIALLEAHFPKEGKA